MTSPTRRESRNDLEVGTKLNLVCQLLSYLGQECPVRPVLSFYFSFQLFKSWKGNGGNTAFHNVGEGSLKSRGFPFTDV